MKNLGIILGRNDTDYVGGVIPYEVRNPSGDWTPYLPTGEIQKGKEDWMDCVTRSATNSIEIQEKLLTGVESNYCDREAAKGSGTTPQGNRLTDVAEYIRKTGLAQQLTYPDSNGTWDEQYQTIPTDIKVNLDTEKLIWLSKWSILHEDIHYTKNSLQYHLKHAPLQVVIPGHAVTEIRCLADVDKIFDSYPPYEKNVPGSYYSGPIIFAKKIVLYKKPKTNTDNLLLFNIKFGDSGKEVEKLINALELVGWRLNVRRSNIYVYDAEIAELVFRFQLANLERGTWSFWWATFYYRGKLVDSRTRDVINKLIQRK